MKKFDYSKPFRTTDGRKATLVRMRPYERGAIVQIDGDTGGGRDYDLYGRHDWGSMPALVHVDMLDTSKPLQTVDGKPVTFVGKLDTGQIVVNVTYPDPFGLRNGRVATELRNADGRKASGSLHSPDDVIVKVVVTEQFRNIYADGTIGETVHKTEQDAKDRTKYGKVRVGVLKQTLNDGKLVAARPVASVAPWFRNSSCPKGRPAVAADFAL